jgi:hypothetical protein
VLCGEAALANFIVKNSTGEGNQKNVMSIRNSLMVKVSTSCLHKVSTSCLHKVSTSCLHKVSTSCLHKVSTSCLHKVKCDITFINEFDYNSPKSILTVILCIWSLCPNFRGTGSIRTKVIAQKPLFLQTYNADNNKQEHRPRVLDARLLRIWY